MVEVDIDDSIKRKPIRVSLNNWLYAKRTNCTGFKLQPCSVCFNHFQAILVCRFLLVLTRVIDTIWKTGAVLFEHYVLLLCHSFCCCYGTTARQCKYCICRCGIWSHIGACTAEKSVQVVCATQWLTTWSRGASLFLHKQPTKRSSSFVEFLWEEKFYVHSTLSPWVLFALVVMIFRRFALLG